MSSRRTRAVSRNTIFGPLPILECENSADYERLLNRFYADLKPKDIIEEGFVHDIAYWTWELWRWRRIKIWLIDAKRYDAFAWAFRLLPNKRLEYIGQTDKIEIINTSMSRGEKKKLKANAAASTELLKELGEERSDEETFWPNLLQAAMPLRPECSWNSSITLSALIKA